MAVGIDTLRLYDRLRTKLAEEQARVIADTLAEVVDNDLATKRDLKELELATKRDLKELEYRLTIRLGSMIGVSVGILLAANFFA